jgi:hypothetical protein
MWEIASIYKWPSTTTQSRGGTKDCGRKGEGFGLNQETMDGDLRKNKKNVRDRKDNHIEKYSRSTGKN